MKHRQNFMHNRRANVTHSDVYENSRTKSKHKRLKRKQKYIKFYTHTYTLILHYTCQRCKGRKKEMNKALQNIFFSHIRFEAEREIKWVKKHETDTKARKTRGSGSESERRERWCQQRRREGTKLTTLTHELKKTSNNRTTWKKRDNERNIEFWGQWKARDDKRES